MSGDGQLSKVVSSFCGESAASKLEQYHEWMVCEEGLAY